jgi:VWFA-related protein
MSDVEAQDIEVRRDVKTEERVMRRFMSQNPALEADLVQLRQLVDGRAAEVYAEATRRTRTTLIVVERTLERLAGRKGRKSLVLASSGFIYDGAVLEFRKILRASLLANTPIFFLDARGLQGLAPYQDVETAAAVDPWDVTDPRAAEGTAAQGAEVLSADTGGFTLRNTNDLAGGLRLIADTSSAYYLLGYNAPPPPPRGAFRKIQVKLGRGAKGLRIMARRGYVAVPAAGH